jgi:type I restriction enzyme S subunit
VLPIERPEPDLVVSTGFTVLRPRASVDTRYFAWAVQSDDFIEEVVSRSVGVSYPAINASEIGDIRVPVPPLEVQRAIADYLDAETARIDALVAKKQRMIDLLGESFLSLLRDEMSKAKSWRRLRQLARLGTGHTPDRNKPEYWADCDIPWVTAADLSSRENRFEVLLDTEQKVSALGVANSAAVVHPAGTVMLCRTASVGLLCVTGAPMATTQAFVTWTPGPDLDSQYLLFALASMWQEWKRLAFGSTHETIYMPDLESVRIPFCPIYEQKAIAEALLDRSRKIARACASIQNQIDLLGERRQALITAAVTGELEIPGVAA